MDFEDFLDGLRDGRWLVPISIGILVIAVVVVAVVAWPQIKPKPKPQAQSLENVVTDTEPKEEAPKAAKKVSKEAAGQIAQDLGVEVSKLTMHYGTGKQKDAVIVRLQKSALKWEEYVYVERDGVWYKQD